MIASITREVCGASCDFGETTITVALVALVGLFVWCLFHE